MSDASDYETSSSESSFNSENEDFLLSSSISKAKKQTKPRKSSNSSVSNSFSTSPTQNGGARSTSTAKSGKGKTIEDIYQKKTQLEHILLRPDTYIGSVEVVQTPMWVINDEGEFEFKAISYVPGLYKIFDEILVNAADNKIRDPTMDTLKVTIEPEENKISVWNNGKGIPIQIHKEEKVYVPELIFGHLLTSSNYDDNEKKVTGGRNGYGAKLCNIFSHVFEVETSESSSQKKFYQKFSNNMSERGTPSITKYSKKEDYTKITFHPDLQKFGLQSIDADHSALLKKRVYDMAGCLKGVAVYLNGTRIKVKDFKQYVTMYLKEQTVVYERVSDRWEVAVGVSDGQFNQMSFVNSICTSKGGTHVDYITNQLVNRILEAVKKKNKSAPIKTQHVKSYLWVFVNCLIENPSFDSQTKENMTLKVSSFGSRCQLTEEFMKKVLKTDILDNVLSFAAVKQDQILKKTDGRKMNRITGIVKLDDANLAGTKNANQCTLILTEGDSAKTFAVTGLGEVGRDHYGVFPLRGKLLNVREASVQIVTNNQEIQYLKQILGLQQGKVYTDVSSLRYGHIMIMTDQDYDGSHIKGLLINFLDHFWPSLLKIPGFLLEFITPVVKCIRGRQEVAFFSIPEYEKWRDENQSQLKHWKIKYYKGLGTSDRAEAKKYFSALNLHRKQFDECTEEDRSYIDMAFNKKKADDRKQWLANYVPGTYMDHSKQIIKIKDFINQELVLFSIADNHRSIPCAVDGLKPGQRKILFACFKRNLTRSEIKVSQLGGYIAEHTAYHHGDQSLTATIVNMAQDFVGSNNINLLEPRGQFGTRLQGGSDSASPRYIFTLLSPLARKIFHPHDDPCLTYLNDDGQSIEPEWYIPILPLLLVNGSQGIGTGWSTTIPNYNPKDIVANLKRLLRGESPLPMVPWYRGFSGTITEQGPDRYLVSGIYRQVDDNTIEILELPVGTWSQTFKTMLEESFAKEKDKALIHNYKDYSSVTKVHFVLNLTQEQMQKALEEGIDKRFKLSSILNTTNMVCFDEQGRIRKYSSVIHILQEFYDLRLKFYSKRKAWLTAELLKDYRKLENKVRFIREIIQRTLIIERKKKKDIVTELKSRGYVTFSPNDTSASVSPDEQVENDEEPEQDTDDLSRGYDYLLNMPLHSLTEEKIAALEKQLADKKAELNFVLKQTPESMWTVDLDAFEQEWEAMEAKFEAANKLTSSKSNKKTKGTKKRVVLASSDDEDNDRLNLDTDDDYYAPKASTSRGKKQKDSTLLATKPIGSTISKINSSSSAAASSLPSLFDFDFKY
ncbi:DNA topoisomerase 2 [Coelomomyces lativittatus]|nr:DNA topoisomerase 2 [Coelomomyces lativittatus]KAJ1511288.1 DNA topoisomerase 2 [Coelomomyces lativittatus]KAJ1512648.1 DNA topoisomerase 2 [Coelomomyces lativittatus]